MKKLQLLSALYLVLAMLAISFQGVFSRQLDCSDISVQFLRAFFATMGFAVVFGLRNGKSVFIMENVRQEFSVILVYTIAILIASFFLCSRFGIRVLRIQ